MALAAATHDSAQQNGAPRSQTTATRAREVEEHETNNALRRQTAPPPGARPGILAPGPMRSDRSLRHSSGNASLLVVATLAAAAADGVDAATLAFLTAREEREKEKKEKEKAKKAPSFFWPGLLASSSPMKRKRLRWFKTSASLRRTSGLWTG